MPFVGILNYMMKRTFFLAILLSFIATGFFGQPIAFHQLTTNNGLNDGWINAICQDKYGYMWFASLGGLNRYNGKTVTTFTHDRTDSSSVPSSICNTIACGPDGRFWLSFWEEMVEFDYSSFTFKKIKIASGFNVNTIIPVADDKLYLAARSGLRCYNPVADRFEELTSQGDTASKLLVKKPVYTACIRGDDIYLGSNGGYIIYNVKIKKARFYPVPELTGRNIFKIMVTSKGDIWISSSDIYRLLRVDGLTGKKEVLDTLPVSGQPDAKSFATNFIEDNNNNIWIITNLNGLLCYQPVTKKLTHFRNDPHDKTSLLSNSLFALYATKDGKIWIGTEVGVNYFNQTRPLFTIGYPFADDYSHTLTRGMEEDHDGNLWFTTGNGISKYNIKTGKYAVWQNQPGKPDVIYYNSVRGITEDLNQDIWVATGKGINRLNKGTGKMDFLTRKDSIPQAFYFSVNGTSDGTVWFGTRDYDGLYYYKPHERKFYSIAGHPVLKRYKGYPVRHVFEDSKKRMWIGYNGFGVLMYDPVNGITKHWQSTDRTDKTIIGNVITSITEDKDAKIWVASFNGITCIDTQKDEFISYSAKEGLRSNIIGGIAVDDSNRLWLATAAGLTMLEKNRRHFTFFGEEAGLPVRDFTEHPALTLSTGEIIMPSSKGYVIFDPLDYRADTNITNCFIAGVELKGNQTISMQLINSGERIRLKHDQNFFTIELEAVNFNDQVWYAYKLDGLEKDWHYSPDPKVVYTSVPGGNYIFRYKATSNVNNWNVEEKTLRLNIATVFYKTWWFWTLIGMLVLSLTILLYRFRLNKQKQILMLETKAEGLEKEKTLVQYESLKQHLNPHFLFNSLTSLRSLIKSDSKTATSFLDGMSKVYRYVLKSGDQELVRLQDELDFVRTFAELQKIRFKEGLAVNINVDESLFNKCIAPVTLQNLVENAIKHNTADKDSPLVIDIFTENGHVVVKNNLQRYRIVETSNKKGLASLRTLYRYYSDKPVEIKENEKYFSVKIPLL
jgi:ligand-binding sensor domain-containing protein